MGTWKTLALESESAPVLQGPDTRTARAVAMSAAPSTASKKTAAAIRAFQLASNLTQSGELDASTVARLRVALRPVDAAICKTMEAAKEIDKQIPAKQDVAIQAPVGKPDIVVSAPGSR
jgi:hypothetical protein